MTPVITPRQKQARSDLWDAVNILDEVENEILFLSTTVCGGWNDRAANGLVYILERIRQTIRSTSDAIQESVKALDEPKQPEPPPFEPTPEMEEIARRFREDWDRAGRDAAAKMKASRDMLQEEATHD